MKKHESELIRLLKARDEQGLTLFLSQYTPLIRYIIAPILPLKEDQEECLSDVAMRVWDKIDSFDESKGQWTSWLTALVRNMALNQARKRKAAEAAEELSDTLAADMPSPEDEVLRAENSRLSPEPSGICPMRNSCCFTENIITCNPPVRLLLSFP